MIPTIAEPMVQQATHPGCDILGFAGDGMNFLGKFTSAIYARSLCSVPQQPTPR